MKTRISYHMANLLLSALGILLFVYSDAAADAARDALLLCGTSVIPSLFPFMVLSDLIVRRDMLSPITGLIPTKRLFGLPGDAALAFLLGGLCGFPIGAKTACDLRKEGRLTRDEAERTAALSNNTGPAFAVSVAGETLHGSRRFGWYLYGAQLISAVIVGLIFRKKDGTTKREEQTAVGHGETFAASFLHALTTAAAAVIPLCGYIVFFAVVCALSKAVIPSPFWGAAVCAVLEFTAGIREAAAVGGGLGLFLTGFAIGFSGLSVMVQTYRFTEEAGLSLRRMFICKIIQGVLTGALVCLWMLWG